MDTFNPSQMPNQPIMNEKKSMGPLVAVIIILTLIIIGGLYFLKLRSSQNNVTPEQQVVPATDQVTDSLMKQNSSDDLDSIERDLNNSNFENLDQGAAVIQAEFVN